MKSLVLALVLVLSAVGCSTAKILPVTASTPMTADLKTVEQAIINGAKDRRWVPKVLGANQIELSLDSRSHRVVVDVTYDKTSYKINYKDSTNMDYNASKNTIHPKYQKWVARLRQAIDARLAQ